MSESRCLANHLLGSVFSRDSICFSSWSQDAFHKGHLWTSKSKLKLDCAGQSPDFSLGNHAGTVSCDHSVRWWGRCSPSLQLWTLRQAAFGKPVGSLWGLGSGEQGVNTWACGLICHSGSRALTTVCRVVRRGCWISPPQWGGNEDTGKSSDEAGGEWQTEPRQAANGPGLPVSCPGARPSSGRGGGRGQAL